MLATSNTFRHQPRSRGLFLGVERGHALPGQPDRGTSADPDPTASRGRSPGGPAWNSTSSLPRFRAGTRVSRPGRRRQHRGGPVLCLWVCWTFKQKEECHGLHLYLVSACPESLGPFSFAQNAAHRRSPESKNRKFQ